MDFETPLAILGILTGLTSLGGVFVTVGREKQARIDLDNRHKELAKEAREAISSLKQVNDKLHDKVSTMEKEQTAMVARAEDMKARLEDVKREKASVESVEALRESMGRVEGLLHGMERRLDAFMREVLKSQDTGE